MFKRIAESIKRRRIVNKLRSYKVGQFSITLPPEHMLDVYQKIYRNYDKKLPAIARLLESKYGLMTVIDIGANIGDTAVGLRDACNAALICIEGNQKFLPLLEENTSKLPGVVRIVPKFMGPESTQNLGRVVTVNGTAHIEREARSDQVKWQQEDFSITTYKELILSNSDLPDVRLVKTDTDGFDFKILIGSINQIASSHPVLFFEFDPSFSPTSDKYEALNAIEALVSSGYVYFIVFDNFGNYLIKFSENASEKFQDLFCFLEQSRNCGGGVVYLDVCCFAEKDKDIFIRLVDSERANSLVSNLAV